MDIDDIYYGNIKHNFLVGNGEKKYVNIWIKLWLSQREYTSSNEYLFPASYRETISMIDRIHFPDLIAKTKEERNQNKSSYQFMENENNKCFAKLDVNFISNNQTLVRVDVLSDTESHQNLLFLIFLNISDDMVWLEGKYSTEFFFSTVATIKYENLDGFQEFIESFCKREMSITERIVNSPLYSIKPTYIEGIGKEFNFYGIVKMIASPIIWFSNIIVAEHDKTIRLSCDTDITWSLELMKLLGKEISERFSNQDTIETNSFLPAWERIEDKNWDREVLRLWWKGLTVPEIYRKTHFASEARIRNRLSELRNKYGNEIIPLDNERRKMLYEKLNRDIL